MDNGKVSIIIPFYNSQEYLAETLESVADQSFINWECLCIDDGSTDNSAMIVENFIARDDRFKIFSRPSHLRKGGNSCRNYGFQQAKGEYVQWFDSDDLMHKQMLEKKVVALGRNQTINYVICHTGAF